METYEHCTRKMENTPDGNSDDESDEMVPQIQVRSIFIFADFENKETPPDLVKVRLITFLSPGSSVTRHHIQCTVFAQSKASPTHT